MKKTLIASAVAAAALSTNAFAMDPATDLAEKVNSMPTIYGNIQLAHFWNEAEDGAGNTIDALSGHGFDDGGSTIGFKHDHQISEGLTGFFKAEFHFDADDKDGANAGFRDGLDEAYIGVKGDFGSIQVGSDDTVYEDFINVVDTSEQIGLNGYLAENGEGDNVQYTGSFGDIGVGLTQQIDNTSSNESTQLAVSFGNDQFYVAAGYAMSRDDDVNGKGQDAIGLAAEMYLGDLTLQAQFETLDESESGQNDGGDYMAVQALYSIGATTLAAGYGILTPDSDAAGVDDESQLYLQALYNVSGNMYVYIEAAQTDNFLTAKDVENTATAVGATYYF